MKYNKFLLLILFLILPCCQVFDSKDSDKVVLSNDWATIIYGEAFLCNNVWNNHNRTDYRQSIFMYTKEDPVIVGWEWSWPELSYYDVFAYPEIIYGKKPWDSSYNLQDLLPISTSETSSKDLIVDFSLVTKSEGVSNLAFSVWLTSALPGAPENVTHEIMVWINTEGEQFVPAGTKQGSLDFDNITYDYYLNLNHGDASGNSSQTWTYVGFKSRQPYLTGTLNFSYFINYLKNQGVVDDSGYIANIEMGNEIIYGKGYTKISKWDVSLN